MKLLFAIKSLVEPGGGAERVLVDVANRLYTRGHDIQVLTLDAPGRSFYELDPGVRRLNICIEMGDDAIGHFRLARALPSLRKAIREKNPDLVIGFMHSMYVPLALALLGTGIRLVASEHADAAHYQSRPVQRALVRFVERLVIAKTVPSAQVRNEHYGPILARVQVLANPIDLSAFSAAVGEKPDQPPLIVSIGSLSSPKGHIDLIHAFAKLSTAFPDWRLRIVGDGKLRPQLEAEIARLSIESRVQMPGFTHDVVAEYASATVVAVPSIYESFGLVAAEALAAGRPVLAFRDCLGIAEMIESGRNGLLVESSPDRVCNLADGLERLMSSRTLRARLAAAGPDTVRRFATEDVVDTWESFLLDLARKTKEG